MPLFSKQAPEAAWKEIGRKVTHELKKMPFLRHQTGKNTTRPDGNDIARRITKGLSVLFLEERDAGFDQDEAIQRGGITRPRRSKIAGLNRGVRLLHFCEMAYSRMGEFRIQLEWQMKKKGGISRRVEHAHTSQRCAACQIVDKKSRNGESFVCVSCGWCHHADKNAAKTFWIMTVSIRGRLAAKPTGIVEAPLQVSRSSQGARITDRMILE